MRRIVQGSILKVQKLKGQTADRLRGQWANRLINLFIFLPLCLFAFLFILVPFFQPNPLFAIGVEVSPGITQIFPWGHFSYKGHLLDVRNDLNYSKIVNFAGRIKIEMPLLIPNVYLMATPLRFEGTSSKEVNFVFGDKTFSKDISFDSRLQLDHYDITFFYSIPALQTLTMEKLNIELGLNARMVDFKGEIKQAALSESVNLTVPIPMGYLGIQFKPVKRVKIESELRAIAYGSNRYFDITGKVKYIFLKFLFVSGGYKYQNIKIDQSSINTDLNLGGPLLEFGVEF